MPDIHFDRTQLIIYITLNFTSGANNTNNPGEEKTFSVVLVKSSTPISWDGGMGGVSWGMQHLVTRVGGPSSREGWLVVVVMVFLLHWANGMLGL